MKNTIEGEAETNSVEKEAITQKEDGRETIVHLVVTIGLTEEGATILGIEGEASIETWNAVDGKIREDTMR